MRRSSATGCGIRREFDQRFIKQLVPRILGALKSRPRGISLGIDSASFRKYLYDRTSITRAHVPSTCHDAANVHRETRQTLRFSSHRLHVPQSFRYLSVPVPARH